MEILAELLFHGLGLVLQFFGELLLNLLGEVLAEVIGHSIKEPFRRARPVDPWFAAVGYAVFGAIAGALSLWLLPASFIVSPLLRMGNLLLTPLASGAAMAMLGAWRERRGQERIRLDRFWYGFCFALAMALVRFVGAH